MLFVHPCAELRLRPLISTENSGDAYPRTLLHCISSLEETTGGSSSILLELSRNKLTHLPKRPNSLETLQVALEVLRRIPNGRTV